MERKYVGGANYVTVVAIYVISGHTPGANATSWRLLSSVSLAIDGHVILATSSFVVVHVFYSNTSVFSAVSKLRSFLLHNSSSPK